MPGLSRIEAKNLADHKVKEISRESGYECEVVDENTRKINIGWVFFYDSSEFIKSGDESWALAGNGPIFISFDGSLTQLPTSVTWQEAMKVKFPDFISSHDID